MTTHDREGLLLAMTAAWAWLHGAWCAWMWQRTKSTSGPAPHKESP